MWQMIFSLHEKKTIKNEAPTRCLFSFTAIGDMIREKQRRELMSIMMLAGVAVVVIVVAAIIISITRR